MNIQPSAYINTDSLLATLRSLSNHADRISMLINLSEDDNTDEGMLRREANMELVVNIIKEYYAISESFRYAAIGELVLSGRIGSYKEYPA